MLKRISKKTVIVITVIAVSFAAIIFGVKRVTERLFIYPLSTYKTIILAAASEYNVNAYMLFALIKTESGFNKNAVSEKGATGLMQLTEKTAEYVARLKGEQNYDLKNAQTNIDFGCYYLKYLFEKFTEQNTVLAAYNAGEGKVAIWLKDSRFSNDGKTLKEIPIEETREYIKRINASSVKYKKLYPNILDKR